MTSINSVFKPFDVKVVEMEKYQCPLNFVLNHSFNFRFVKDDYFNIIHFPPAKNDKEFGGKNKIDNLINTLKITRKKQYEKRKGSLKFSELSIKGISINDSLLDIVEDKSYTHCSLYFKFLEHNDLVDYSSELSTKKYKINKGLLFNFREVTCLEDDYLREILNSPDYNCIRHLFTDFFLYENHKVYLERFLVRILMDFKYKLVDYQTNSLRGHNSNNEKIGTQLYQIVLLLNSVEKHFLSEIPKKEVNQSILVKENNKEIKDNNTEDTTKTSLNNELVIKIPLEDSEDSQKEEKKTQIFDVQEDNNQKTKQFKCEICQKIFSSSQGLGGHKSCKHPKTSSKYFKMQEIREKRQNIRNKLKEIKGKLFQVYGLDYENLLLLGEKQKIKEFLNVHYKEYRIFRKKGNYNLFSIQK